jgi:cytosine/adenosine deaminase-related metal-dependent hydrolase
MSKRVVSLVNARVVTPDGEAESVRFDSRILEIGARPQPSDEVLDLDGEFVLPGLVNAHDHLELNHYGRLKFRGRYTNVSGWLDDMRPRLLEDPRIRAGRAFPLADRLFIGALKNLLAGVTTVAHHNVLYPELRHGFPIRIVRRYGWAHSLDLDEPSDGTREHGEPVIERHRATPPDLPFFIHVAEGVDDQARAELARLDVVHCLTPNVVLVHGVGIDVADWRRVLHAKASLVWCPGSNLFLFDRTAPIRQFLEGPCGRHARIALGTDSRLSGRRDLLDELDAAASTELVSDSELLRMVTSAAADVLRQPAAGRIRIGAPADLVILPALADTAARALVAATRRDVRLVVVGGRPLVGDTLFASVFSARHVGRQPLSVDCAEKIADAALGRRIRASSIAEVGLKAA